MLRNIFLTLLVVAGIFSLSKADTLPIITPVGNTARILKPNLSFLSLASILTGTDDPTLIGQDAPKGSLYLRIGGSGGDLYTKQDNGNTTNWLTEKQRSSVPIKEEVLALMFSNLTTFINIPLPFAPVNGVEFSEGKRLAYDGETPDGFGGNISGDYTATGLYTFHDNGDSTGTLTRSTDWSLGMVIEKGTMFHIGEGGVEFDIDINGRRFFQMLTTETVGAGDFIPLGPGYLDVIDYISSSGTLKKPVSTVSIVNTPLTGITPGTLIGGHPIANGNSAFLANQTPSSKNGFYTYDEGSQKLNRRGDSLVGLKIPKGTMFSVNSGDYANKLIRLDGFIVGHSTGQEVPHDVVGSAAPASSSNIPNYIVKRDGFGSFAAQDISAASILLNGGLSASNVVAVINDGHIKHTQTTPPTAAPNVNAGTGATCTVSNATDNAGTITLTTGSGAWALGTQCTVTFNKLFNIAPICHLYPVNNNAAAASPNLYVTSDVNGLSPGFDSADEEPMPYILNYTCSETQ